MSEILERRRSSDGSARLRPALDEKRAAPIIPVVVVAAAGAAIWAWELQFGTYGARFLAMPVTLAVFLAVQITVPRMRWQRDWILSPGNIAMILFAFQLVVVPVLLVTPGPPPGPLVLLPADQYINAAMLLQALAYVSYAIGFVLLRGSVRSTRLLPGSGVTMITAVIFLALGALGLVLQFPSIGALRDYFTGQGDIFVEPGSATLSDAAGTFLRPFLAYGVILLWAAQITRRRPGQRIRLGELGLAVLAIVASATYDYNRASVVVPIVALVTAYSAFGRQLHPRRILTLLLLLAVISYQFGEYRGEYSATRGGQISATQAGLHGPKDSFTDALQIYANGPQFWGTVLEDVDRSGLREGSTFLGSALLPVPILGKPFRAESGPNLYNELVYGHTEINDQILGFGAELYWNFGVPAVIAGYLLLGLIVRRLDDHVRAAADPLSSYTWAYCGIWVALLVINSISVITQIIVYFSWPITTMIIVARFTLSKSVEESS